MTPTPRGAPPFDEVVRRHGATVLRVCRAVLGPGPDADDAWSETFLSALRVWPTPVDNTEAWLVRIAHRKAIDVIRGRERRAVPTAEPAAPGARPVVDPAADATGEVWAAVAHLPERQRLAVAYHWFGGLPHTETAELTGSTPAAVRRAAADGLATLRRVLAVHPTSENPGAVESPSSRRTGAHP